MAKPFVFNDESVVNSFGFFVRNSGGNFDRFKDNPVMLYEHSARDLLGRWENLRVEGSKLLADPVFDTDDVNAKVYEGKVERGFLKGCSMGIQVLDAELVDMPGKGPVPAVTKWELMEVSITPVPSNGNSLRLYSEKGELLSALNEVQLSIDKFINKTETTMSKIVISKEAATVLKIGTEVSDGEALSAAVMALSAAKEKSDNDLRTLINTRAVALIDSAIKEGRLTADKKESFVKLAETDFGQASDLISAMPAKQTMSGKVTDMTGTKGQPGGREDWDYLKWSKEDPKGLAKMRAERPDEFEALRASYSKQ
jgi:HK97 family phage prohead protease